MLESVRVTAQKPHLNVLRLKDCKRFVSSSSDSPWRSFFTWYKRETGCLNPRGQIRFITAFLSRHVPAPVRIVDTMIDRVTVTSHTGWTPFARCSQLLPFSSLRSSATRASFGLFLGFNAVGYEPVQTGSQCPIFSLSTLKPNYFFVV